MIFRFLIYILVFCTGFVFASDTTRVGNTLPWSKRIADSFLLRHPDAVTYDTGFTSTKWNYEQGLMLHALTRMWECTGDQKYFDFVRNNLQQYVDSNGIIKTYRSSDFNLDNVAGGRSILTMYKATSEERYRIAADTLRWQLRNQPRTESGGFWHKKIYPNQMWLDGLYMAEPFYAAYAAMFKVPSDFDDIAGQFILIAEKTYDAKTGLYFHGWDESRNERWADQQTGCSPSFWSRSIGWYAMALVDVLDILPPDHPKRSNLETIMKNLAETLLRYRDRKTGLWFQVTDQGDREGNYLEASGTCMFMYMYARGANQGYLDQKYLEEAAHTFRGVVDHLVTVDSNGFVNLHHICKGSGLGGTPYRDGSFNYYISEQQRTNDMKGIGPFLLGAIELERTGLSKKKEKGE